MSDFSGIPTVVLESLRVRLVQLVHSLTNLQAGTSGPHLSQWASLHQQFNVALLQLESVVSTLESVPDATQRALVYPQPNNFSVRAMGGLLTTLLRKKNLPDVEAWIAEGNALVAEEQLDTQQDDDFSEWAWQQAEESTQISVKPLHFAAPPSAGGWGLDKCIGFMAGHT